MFKKLTSALIAVIMVLSLTATAFAADTSSYVYVWTDSNTQLLHVQHYAYDVVGAYMDIDDRVTVKGNSLYDMAGVLIANDLKGYSNNKPTVALNNDGLYFLSKDGELRYMEHSTDQTYSVANITADYIGLDVESMAANVTSGRKTWALRDLTFSGNYKRNDDPVVVKGAYVKSYAVDGDPEKIGYDAYSNNKRLLTTYCRISNVWQNDYKVLLSNTCKGAKFCGYTGTYSIYLYDMSTKTVYEFKLADKFSTAYTVLKGETVYMFERNDAGFVSAIVTDKGTHPVDTTVTTPTVPQPGTGNGGGNNGGGSTTGNVTSVKNFLDKSMAYEGKNLYGTLSYADNSMSWKGTVIYNGNDVVDFGITCKGAPVFTKTNGDTYVYRNGQSEKVATSVNQVVYGDNGIAEAVKTTGNKTLYLEASN